MNLLPEEERKRLRREYRRKWLFTFDGAITMSVAALIIIVTLISC